jgi:signal transduction histidine kinase
MGRGHQSFDAPERASQPRAPERMSPLPRYLALALFVALAALSALLAAPVWRGMRAESAHEPTAMNAPAPSAQIVVLSQRLSLLLAVTSAAVALTLIVSLATQPPRSNESRPPLAAARREIGTLAKLAESSAAQGAELHRERDVRRRAEEDAQLKQQLLAQSFDEKIRLGRDLHDGIIQSLYAVGLTLESVRALVKTDPAQADRRLEETRASLNSAIREVRAYITGLTPDNLRRAGFAHAVNGVLAELTAGRPAQFDLDIDEDAAALLTADQSVEALQIAREAVSNALRHGGASRITLRVHQGEREICLLVQDNGAGFKAAARREGGHGLGNMHARAERIGGTLRIASEPGEGTRVIATLPILQSTVS